MTSRTLGTLLAACMATSAWAGDEPTGTYTALVDVAGEPTQLSITFNAAGQATGTVEHRRQRHLVRGSAEALFVAERGRRTSIHLIRPQGGEVNGFLTMAGRTASFAAVLRGPAQIVAGRYTVITPAIPKPRPTRPEEPPTEPPAEPVDPAVIPHARPKYLGGHGYGVMTITPAGQFRITMRLADGQRFSAGKNVASAFAVSFVAAPNLSGSFSGNLRFREIEDSSDADGVFRWVRDRLDGRMPIYRYGFEAQERLMASRYKPDQIPLKGDSEPRGRLAIKGGILTRNSATAIYFDDGELSAPEYRFKSRLNQFSGTFASALILPVYGVPARTGGVVFQKQNRIYGMSETRYGTSGVNIERKNEHLKD
jgi:hypothetical protein